MPPKAVHLDVEERRAKGRTARKLAPRSSHAAFAPAADRPDPIALLEQQAASRVPDLVPIRYGRMLASPFAFYRGAALIMAADLAQTPTSGLRVQLCGDAHLSNFGVFATPERRLTFDINDFDETLPGPWEWDVKRLAASLVVAGRDRGFSAAQSAFVAGAAVAEYRTAMAHFATRTNLDVWYASIDIDRLMPRLRSELGAVRAAHTQRTLDKARTRDSRHAMTRFTHQTPDGPRFVSDPPLTVPVTELLPELPADELTARLREVIRAYRRTLQSDRRELLEQYRMVDLARRVVGVGSVGTRAWVALFLGQDSSDPLVLQVKEAQASVLEGFVGRSAHGSHGQRVVAGQRLMQAASDIFLGWKRVTSFDGETRDFYVRQFRDWKGSAAVEAMRPAGMAVYARVCGWTLARAHARSGDRVAIAAYLGSGDTFDRAVVAFAEAYADQNERDHAALRQAVRQGRLTAVSGL